MKKWKLLLLILLPLLAFGKWSLSDDTDIYTVDPTVQANVLIILDNSASMDQGLPYDYQRTYTGDYNVDKVYRRECLRKNPWNKNQCLEWGYRIYNGTFTDSDHDGRDDRDDAIKSGNFLNYLDQTLNNPDFPRKINMAKDAIKSLIDTTENVRFGLMVLNPYSSEGGLLLAPCGTDKATLKSIVDCITILDAHSNLAEALTHAGVYFRDGFSIYRCAGGRFSDTNTNAPSPIQYSCQANYIVTISDCGLAGATGDVNRRILATFLGEDISRWDKTIPADPQNDFIRDPNTGELQPQNHLLDDVAKVLQTIGVNHPTFGPKRIFTYTIGFATEDPLLKLTAREGGGSYMPVSNASQLTTALESYLLDITTRSTIYACPVVPANKTMSGDRIYVPFAYPNMYKSFWKGDLKKYGLSSGGVIVDANGAPATDSDGNFQETAVPYWSVNEKLRSRRVSDREIFSWINKPNKKIKHTDHIFKKRNEVDAGNNRITLELLGNPTCNAGESEDDCVTRIVQYVRGADVYDENGNGNTTEPRADVLGDILHSSPAVVKYSSSQTVVFFGANDGMLHAINDSDGSEMWAFIPPDLLPKLKYLIEGGRHEYFIDSSPKVISLNPQGLIAGPTETVSRRVLIFGERRGGNSYWALDVTDPSDPQILWTISSASPGFGELGETWSEPFFGNVNYAGVPMALAFFGGGYSPDNTKGRAVYAVNMLTGEKVWQATGMSNCIPSSVLGVDVNDDTYIDRLYVGDLGGQMWAFASFPTGDSSYQQDGEIGGWSSRLLFQSGGSRKIFEPPDVVMEVDGYHLYFGTGNRQFPRDTTEANRLYLVKDKNLPAGEFTTLSEANLADVTANLVQSGTSAEQAATWALLRERAGWFIQLENSGEKVLAPATVFHGVAFFTTFSPFQTTCSFGGDGRVYAVNYLSGAAIFNWSDINDGNGAASVAKADRSLKLARGGIPTEVIITIQPPGSPPLVGGASVAPNAAGTVTPLVGAGGGISTVQGPPMNMLTPFSWRDTSA